MIGGSEPLAGHLTSLRDYDSVSRPRHLIQMFERCLITGKVTYAHEEATTIILTQKTADGHAIAAGCSGGSTSGSGRFNNS